MNCVRHIDVFVSEFVRPFNSTKDIHADLIAALVPQFSERVKFALIEVLELDKEISEAKTWVFSDKSDDELTSMVQAYFSEIGILFAERRFTLSSAYEFYFGDRVFFSCVESPKATRLEEKQRRWFGPTSASLERDIDRSDAVDADHVQSAYDEYVSHLSKTLLKDYPVGYVLLVPVALSHSDPTRRRKIGAVFLHLGLNERVANELSEEQVFAQTVFQRINLHWHYNLTAESLFNQTQLAESARAAAVAATLASDQLKKEQTKFKDKVLPVLNDMSKAIGELKVHVAPAPIESAIEAFGRLREIMCKCFPRDLHDPYNHENIYALKVLKDEALSWVNHLSASLAQVDVSQIQTADHGQSTFQARLIDLLLKPMLECFQGDGQPNDPNAPHPALCLAKCISNGRIPLAWYFVMLGIDRIEDEHWRQYLEIGSAFYVLRAVRIIATKFSLIDPQIEETDGRVVVTLQPTWENYSHFLERMGTELKLDAPSGGSARELVRLMRDHCHCVIVPSSPTEAGDRMTFCLGNKPLCEISISELTVKFALKTHHEPTKASIERGRGMSSC